MTEPSQPETEPAPGGQGRTTFRPGRVQLLALALVSLLAVGPLLAAVVAWTGGSDPTRDLLTADEVDLPDLGLELAVTVAEVDAEAGVLRLRVDPRVQGGDELPDEILLVVNEVAGERSRVVSSRSPVPFGLSVPLERGSVSRYPFDSYDATVFALASADGRPLPLVITMDSVITGQRLDAVPSDEAAAEVGRALVEVDIARGYTTVLYAVGVMGLMWGLAIGAVAVSWVVVVGRVEPDMWIYGFFVGVLFALPPLRGSLPGEPPAGTLFDFVAFYWSVAVVATVLLLLLFTWVRRARARSSPPPIDDLDPDQRASA